MADASTGEAASTSRAVAGSTPDAGATPDTGATPSAGAVSDADATPDAGAQGRGIERESDAANSPAPRASVARELQVSDRLRQILDESRESAREQLNAAWQILIDRVFEERFAELSARLETQLRSELETQIEAAATEARVRARRDISGRLSQAARRLRSFENESQWSRAVVDATDGFCRRAAVFVVHGPALRLQAARGVASDIRIDNTPLDAAPAFAGAVHSRDTIVALRSRGELSEPIANLLGEASDKRFYLLPIQARERVAAILYADSDVEPDSSVDLGALELLATFASAVLEGQTPASDRSGLVSISAAAGAETATEAEPAASKISWSSLNKEEQELHLRAQRFARVQAASMRLYQSGAVKQGRRNRDLYGALREDIDRARNDFRRDFLSASPTMVDYVHVELLRTLANDDAELLGPEYPGPMA